MLFYSFELSIQRIYDLKSVKEQIGKKKLNHGFKNIRQHICFNIDDNKKQTLSTKSAYYDDL